MPCPIKNIFIADDDMDDIGLFTDALTEVSPGVNLSIAENGVALINLLNIYSTPDIIVLDLNMPYKTGKQCLKEIRTQHKYNEIPVIVFSTSRRVAEVRNSVSEGLNYYIMKPWTYPDLKAMINKICQGRVSEL